MKQTLALVLLVFGIVGCSPEEDYVVITEELNLYQSYEDFEKEVKERANGITEKEKERKVKELIVRCEEFGFKGDNNIAACVQREVQFDLALAKQEEKIDQLENRINSLAQSQESKTESSSSILVDLLSIIADEAERQNEMEQTVRLYRLESKVDAIDSRNNSKQAMCVLNRNCP